MTDEQWIETIETIQSETSWKGLINPLDILILAYKRSKGHNQTLNWRLVLYRLSERLKKFIHKIGHDRAFFEGRSILFFPVEPTHLKQMMPVARLLAENDIPFHFMTARMQLFKSLKLDGFRVHLITGSNRRLAGHIGIVKLRDLKPILSHFSPTFAHYIERSYSEILRLSTALQIILKDSHPCYVFIGNDLTWEGRLMARIAKKMNLRTGMIQHGLLGHEIYNGLHIVDDFYLYGQAFRRILEEDGLVGSNLQVTGPPYLDQKRYNGSTVNVRLQKIFDLKGPFVLVALSGPGDRTSVENYGQALSIISRLISDHPDVEFVIKLHRKESIEAYATFPSRQRFRIVDRDSASKLPDDIFDWLGGCTCLITGTSAVAYEAMLYNIPIISVDPLKEYQGVNFVDERIVDVVHTYQELEEALIRVNGKRVDYRPFINDIYGELDGKAANRVAAGIANYAKR